MVRSNLYFREAATVFRLPNSERQLPVWSTTERLKRKAKSKHVPHHLPHGVLFLSRAGELEDALDIALKAAGGVHRQLLDLGLSCEDLGKTSVHLSVQAQEAPAEVCMLSRRRWWVEDERGVGGVLVHR